MSFIICEYEKVKEGFPEFKRTLESLESSLRAKCAADWSPKTFGKLTPSTGQFGETTILPPLFRDQTMALASSGQMITWDQWLTFTATEKEAGVGTAGVGASKTIMTGSSGSAGTILEDYKVGLAGLAFLDKSIRISEIKMQISDRKLPRMNIEEAFAYNKPAIIFEEGYILDEETGFELVAYVLSEGPQRIKPLGLQMVRIPNKLQVTLTGASIA